MSRFGITRKRRLCQGKAADDQAANLARNKNGKQECGVPVYAETLLGATRRSGFAPGIGNCIRQKFVSGEMNSTPIYCFQSRDRWMEPTRHSGHCPVPSFAMLSFRPTDTT